MSTEPASKTTFVRGNERLNEVLADPDIAAGVAEVELDLDPAGDRPAIAPPRTEQAAGS